MVSLVPVDGDPFAAGSPAPQTPAQPQYAPPSQGAPYTGVNLGPLQAAPQNAPATPRLVPVQGDPFAQAPPSAEPNAPVSATGSVTQTATGLNEGLASSVLRPLDVIPYLVSKAMGGEGVHPFEGTFREHFVDPMGQPQNRFEQSLRAGGRMAGENLPLMATGAGVAGSGLRAGITAAEQAAPVVRLAPTSLVDAGANALAKVRGVTDSVLDGMAAHPVASAVGENTGAFESGVGGNIGRNVSKDNGGDEEDQQAAEMAGQFALPSVAGAYSKFISPATWAARGAKYAAGKALDTLPEAALPERLRPASNTYEDRKADQSAYSNREGKYEDPNVPAPAEGNFMTRRMDAGQAKREGKAAEAAGKEFNQIIAQPDAAANLAEAQRLEQTIPGFKPGVAKATQDPALLKLQDSMESRATGDELRQVQQNADASTKAIRDYKDNIIPGGGENPQDVAAKANADRVQGVNKTLDAQTAATTDKIKGISDSLPEVDPTVTGNLMRETRAGLKTEADKQMYHLRGQVDPSGTGVVSLPPKTPDGEPVNMSVNAALDRRAAINQELADHYGASNRDQAAVRSIRQLQEEKATLDDAIEHASSNGAEGLKAYNDYYKNEYAPKFLQGASKQVGQFSRNGYDGNKVASEDVPTKLLGPNSISEARQVNKLYGDNPEVKQQIIDHHLDDLRRTAIDPNTGQIKEGAVNKYLAKNERLFNEMPWVRDAIASKNPDDLYARLGQLEQRQRAVADTKAASLLGKNPEQHIDAALNDWQVMRGLRNSVRGDPQAEMALRKAVINRAPDPMNVDAFQKFLDGNDRSLRQVLEPDHLKALKDVLSAAKINNTLPRPKGAVDLPGSLADKGAKVFGISVPSLLQRMLSVKQGRMSPEYGVADVGLRALRQFSNKEIENAWKEALYNPKVAKDLQLMVKQGPTVPKLANMRNYMLSVGMHDAQEPK